MIGRIGGMQNKGEDDAGIVANGGVSGPVVDVTCRDTLTRLLVELNIIDGHMFNGSAAFKFCHCTRTLPLGDTHLNILLREVCSGCHEGKVYTSEVIGLTGDRRSGGKRELETVS